MIPQYPVEIANEIEMIRSQYIGSFLIVEGRDDRLFMENFVSNESCNIIVAQGKRNVQKVIDTLENRNFIGALGLVDADFDRIEGVRNTNFNILMYEHHDLETMLICSPALERVLNEFGSREKLEGLRKNVLKRLIERALVIAYLRLYSLRTGLNLRFENVNYAAWISRTSFDTNIDDLIQEIKNKSLRPDLPSEDLHTAMDEIERSNYDPREICNGTDLIEILSIGLRRVFGTNSANDVNGKILRQSLRLAYSEQYFVASKLYNDIRVWEAQVIEFNVLRT